MELLELWRLIYLELSTGCDMLFFLQNQIFCNFMLVIQVIYQNQNVTKLNIIRLFG